MVLLDCCTALLMQVCASLECSKRVKGKQLSDCSVSVAFERLNSSKWTESEYFVSYLKKKHVLEFFGKIINIYFFFNTFRLLDSGAVENVWITGKLFSFDDTKLFRILHQLCR